MSGNAHLGRVFMRYNWSYFDQEEGMKQKYFLEVIELVYALTFRSGLVSISNVHHTKIQCKDKPTIL